MQTKLSRGAELFDVWMKEESDLIQALAKAYGERICVDQVLIAAAEAKDVGLKYY
jgi:acyl-CoA oxidase